MPGFGALTHPTTNMLLDRSIDARYAARPGQRSAAATPEQARAALRWIATRMSERGTRDLAWWRVHEWASPWPFRIVAAVAVALWFLLNWLLANTGATDPAISALVIGPPTLLSAVVLVLLRRRDLGGIHVLPRLSWRSVIRPTAATVVSAAVLGMLLELALTLWQFGGDLGQVDPGRQAVAMLLFGAVFAIGSVPIALAWVVSRAQGATPPLTPTAAWRESRKESRVVALLIALGVWLPFGLAWLVMGILGGMGWLGLWLLGGLVLVGLELALTIGVIRSPTSRAKLAAGQLAVRARTPVRLMKFLEDAHARGVLRTVGPVYQFRHAGLQDRLAVGAPGQFDSPSQPRLAVDAPDQHSPSQPRHGLPQAR